MIDFSQVAQLAHLFARAAIDSGGWMPALAALGSATHSGHGELVVVGAPGSGIAAQSWMSNRADFDHAAFMAAGGYSPGANPRIAASMRARPLEVIHEAHYDAVEPLLDRGDVLAIFEEARIEAGCQAALIQDSRLLVGLAVLRGGRDGRTTTDDRALFAAVAPHVRAAALVQLGIERQGAALLAGAFEAMQAAAFLIDASGRVLGRTPAAERLLARGVLRLADGRLIAPRDEAALSQAISRRLQRSEGLQPPLITLALHGGSEASPSIVDVSALPSAPWGFGAAPRVLVVVRGGGTRRDATLALLRQAWDLSAAEADVVMRLLDGQARSAIAVARGVSVETVRAQLKSIFAKAGVSREAELTARAGALAARAG